MCGISGIVSTELAVETMVPKTRAMTDAQRHRGPDDSGLEEISRADPAVVFGHRRLAIIDLTPAGHQPMHDPATGSWITFNGEIYNYRELRRELELCGQCFSTQCDTEVILKAYARWGSDCVSRLRGIFAFAIWDPGDARTSSGLPRLLLARDHLGVKPLYYSWDGRTLVFASEVRALLASNIVERRLDAAGLQSYLAYGSVQDPLTMIRGVSSLLPGYSLMWRDGGLQHKRYWRLPGPEQVSEEAPADLHDQMRVRLSEAVRMQLVADVPIGIFLSGGIDSTAIAALAKAADSAPVKTLSIVFDDPSYDESRFARIASQHIGTSHQELMLTEQCLLQAIPQALAAFDQPSVDGLNSYFVSRLARDAGLTVALSGLGGDEVFGGYDGHRKAILAERWGKRVGVFPAGIRSRLSRLVRRSAHTERSRKAADLLEHPESPYLLVRRVFSDSQIGDILDPEFERGSASREPETLATIAAEFAGYDIVSRVSAWEIQTFLVSTLLRDADQMSMAHALEVRVPLIDHQLVEYLFTIPGKRRLSRRCPKPLLTEPLDGALPADCVYRKKQGFVLPFSTWLHRGVRPLIRDSLLGSSAGALFPLSKAGLARVWDQFEYGRISWSRVWCLHVLLCWLKEHGIMA